MAQYNAQSPWYLTEEVNNQYLDIMVKRPIPADPGDILYEIQPQYMYRPDLLAFDLYKSSKLWWVFAVRNNEVLKDPVFDFIPGNKIFLPKQSTLNSILGA